MKTKWIIPLILFAFIVPLCHASTSATLYFRSDTQTKFGVTGYKLSPTQSSSGTSDLRTVDDSQAYNISYGVRIWNINWNETQTELTSATPVAIVSRTSNGYGIQSASWTYSGNEVLDVIIVKVYQRFGAGAWSLRATFIMGDYLEAKTPTFTFRYWTERDTFNYDSTWKTSSFFRWGSATHNSRVDVSYTEPNPWEIQAHRLNEGNLIQFVVYPYVYIIGNVFYGLCFLGLGMTLYKRYENIVPVAIILMFFGGTGGVATMLIPAVGLQLGWLVMVFGLAVLLWSLVKGYG